MPGQLLRHREERKHRLNREIMSPEVRLTGPENEPLGVVSLMEALRQAGELDVDLVEISPTANPPVCRLMDYGKFKYQEQKKGGRSESQADGHRDQGDQVSSWHG